MTQAGQCGLRAGHDDQRCRKPAKKRRGWGERGSCCATILLRAAHPWCHRLACRTISDRADPSRLYEFRASSRLLQSRFHQVSQQQGNKYNCDGVLYVSSLLQHLDVSSTESSISLPIFLCTRDEICDVSLLNHFVYPLMQDN